MSHPSADQPINILVWGKAFLKSWTAHLNGKTLAELNAHPRDDQISFQKEGHLYTIRSKTGHPVSMTTLISRSFPPFEADKVIRNMMTGRRWKEGQSPHLPLAIEVLGQLWMMQTQATQAKIAAHPNQPEAIDVPIITPSYDLADSTQAVPPPPILLSEGDRAFFRGILLSPKWSNSPLFQPVSDGIKNRWATDNAKKADLGTDMHEQIEDFFNGRMVEIPDTPEFRLFLEWWREFSEKYPQYQPGRTEWTLYDEDWMVSGSIDFALFGPDGEVIIVDWKRTQEIKYSNDFTKGFAPLNHLDDCNYVHYGLQQNGYRYMVETKYDRQVVGMYLVVCHPKQDHYQMIELPDLQTEIKQIWP